MNKEKLQHFIVNAMFAIVYAFGIVVLFMDALVWRPH